MEYFPGIAMLKYIFLLIVYIPFFIISMLLAPLLVLFAVMRDGPADNGHTTAIEPRLPNWLFWFDTTTDNGLWGDHGWRTIHCKSFWGSYFGMIGWLWRNPACGFAWSVLSHMVVPTETFTVTSSGCGLNLDKGQGTQGWFLVRSSAGAFQYRWVKVWAGRQWSFEAGWLLDVYVKEPALMTQRPRAPFSFQPRCVKARAHY